MKKILVVLPVNETHKAVLSDALRGCEDSYELVGEGSGKRYVLGQTVKVRVNAVDMALRAVDFVLYEDEG